MTDPRDLRIAELEAEVARLRAQMSTQCPFDLRDDPRSDIEETDPCPVCGMLGVQGAEDVCVGGPRSGSGEISVARSSNKKSITKAQRKARVRARDLGNAMEGIGAWRRMGGAYLRMLHRMEADGLLGTAPFPLTEMGRALVTK